MGKRIFFGFMLFVSIGLLAGFLRARPEASNSLPRLVFGPLGEIHEFSVSSNSRTTEPFHRISYELDHATKTADIRFTTITQEGIRSECFEDAGASGYDLFLQFYNSLSLRPDSPSIPPGDEWKLFFAKEDFLIGSPFRAFETDEKIYEAFKKRSGFCEQSRPKNFLAELSRADLREISYWEDMVRPLQEGRDLETRNHQIFVRLDPERPHIEIYCPYRAKSGASGIRISQMKKFPYKTEQETIERIVTETLQARQVTNQDSPTQKRIFLSVRTENWDLPFLFEGSDLEETPRIESENLRSIFVQIRDLNPCASQLTSEETE